MTTPFEFDVPNLDDAPQERRVTQHRCVGCDVLSPPVETSFTLISSRFGWRLHRYSDEQTGERVMEWRCPHCWMEFKQERRRRLSDGMRERAEALTRASERPRSR